MRMTIGARFSVDKPLLPLVDSVLDVTIVGFANDEDIGFIFPLARQKFVVSKKIITTFSFNIYPN
jgi:hypothetical protein